jgi:two-component system, sensor histidine kinase PdtaS
MAPQFVRPATFSRAVVFHSNSGEHIAEIAHLWRGARLTSTTCAFRCVPPKEIMNQTLLFEGLRDAPTRGTPGILARIGSMVVAPRRLPFIIGFTALAFLAAFCIRYWLDAWFPPGFPFITFFPALLLISVFAGIRAASVAAVFAFILAWYFFLPPGRSFELNSGTAMALVFFVVVVLTQIVAVAVIKHAMFTLQAEQIKSARLAHARELMFQELQHRVSNNLATVAALLRLQASRIPDKAAKQALGDAQIRISTISRLQRRMHSPNNQSLDLATFLREIAEDCLQAAGVNDVHEIVFDLASVALNHDDAIIVGLVVSELLMNAVEHGAPPDAPLKIHLSLKAIQSDKDADKMHITIVVRDNGPGVAESFRLEQSKSLGLGIARQFAAQLGGGLNIRSGKDGGAISTLDFTVSRIPDA